MTREIAFQLLTKHLTNPILLKHSLSVEAAMRALSVKFHGDIEEWGITGLLHDADYEKSRGNPNKHGLLLFELEPNSIPTVVEHAIKAHNGEFTKVAPVSPMDWALYCSDELTGIIMALTQVDKDLPAGRQVKQLVFPTQEIVLQKLQDKNFAKGAKKEKILQCEAKLGIPLPEFVEITLKAMQSIQQDLEIQKT